MEPELLEQARKESGVPESIFLEPLMLELIEKVAGSSNSGGVSIKPGQSGCSSQAASSRLASTRAAFLKQATVHIQKFGRA